MQNSARPIVCEDGIFCGDPHESIQYKVANEMTALCPFLDFCLGFKRRLRLRKAVPEFVTSHGQRLFASSWIAFLPFSMVDYED